MTPELIAAFGQFGPLGLMIGYLVWRETKERAAAIARDADVIKRDLAQADANKELAAALAALTVTIQNMLPGSRGR